MLQVACGIYKNKMPQVKKIIGIGINSPKFSDDMMEDFILFPCDEWTKEDIEYFEEQNKIFQFWEHENTSKENLRIFEYPALAELLLNKTEFTG